MRESLAKGKELIDRLEFKLAVAEPDSLDNLYKEIDEQLRKLND